MKLDWSARARADLDDIYSYVEADNPLAAIAMDERINERIEGLLRFPRSGRIGRVKGTRELVIDRTPYLAIYTIEDDAIRILRILHSARMWPDERLGSK